MLQQGFQVGMGISFLAVANMPDGDRSRSRPRRAAKAAGPSETTPRCPECRDPIRPDALETHLRQVHGIYQFRGIRRSFNDTLATLLGAIATDPPDPEAWRTFAAIAAENHGPRDDMFLALTLGQVLTRVPAERRDAVLESLGALIGREGATGLAVALASDAEILARQLALIVIANLPQPLDNVLLPPMYGLLLDRRLAAEWQFGALAAILRTFGTESPLAEKLLQTLISGLGKARSIERLRRLELHTGKSALLDAMCARLEDRLRMRCPRCPTQLRRPEMIVHLWNEHQLVLDGRRVREPWGMVEEWIECYLERPDPELLDRCRTLVQRLDPDDGPHRLQRLLLSRGVEDAEARRSLTEEAAEKHAACCPWCYGLVPVAREVPPLILNHYRGRLSGGGYRVEVSERGLRTALEIVTPYAVFYRGREPGQLWTLRGAQIVFVGPFMLLALALAFRPAGALVGPLGPVLAVLFVAGLAYLLVRRWWQPRVPPGKRVRNYAWTLLAPHLHADGFRLDDSAFLAGLAHLSGGDGYGPLREAFFPDLMKRTENAMAVGLVPPGHLAALRRLMVEDAVARGADPVPLVAELLARCFEGRWSLRFAEHLMDQWRAPWWSAGRLARLRVLLCDRAFAAGFEVRNLLDAGQAAPALGAILATADVPRLAALRLLWSLRPTRPWDRCGDARTVFELATDPDLAELLGRYPDLLLYQEEPDWLVAAPGQTRAEPVQILFCVRGIVLQGILFTQTPREVEVNSRWRYSDLVLGEHRFRSPDQLDALALRMERWFRYAFSDFLPSLPQVEKWKAPDRIAILRAWGAVPCPECQRSLLPRVGQVGIALAEEEKAPR